MADSACLQCMSSALDWSNSTCQPFLTSKWHFWQMVQMSAQCLLCKTEKAQISGQMQIICTGWHLWTMGADRPLPLDWIGLTDIFNGKSFCQKKASENWNTCLNSILGLPFKLRKTLQSNLHVARAHNPGGLSSLLLLLLPRSLTLSRFLLSLHLMLMSSSLSFLFSSSRFAISTCRPGITHMTRVPPWRCLHTWKSRSVLWQLSAQFWGVQIRFCCNYLKQILLLVFHFNICKSILLRNPHISNLDKQILMVDR